MSQYLVLRKNGVEFCSFSRSNILYDKIGAPYTTDWEPFKVEWLRECIADMREEINDDKNHLDKLNSVNGMSYEDTFNLIMAIEDLEKEIKIKEYWLHICEFLMDLVDMSWSDDKWEYCIE